MIGSYECGKEPFGSMFHERQEISWQTGWLLASQWLCSVQSVVFCYLLIKFLQIEGNYLIETAVCHNSIDHSLKALYLLFHTHCINLHYVLNGPILRTLSLCFV